MYSWAVFNERFDWINSDNNYYGPNNGKSTSVKEGDVILSNLHLSSGNRYRMSIG
jgi:hypothetical protein